MQKQSAASGSTSTPAAGPEPSSGSLIGNNPESHTSPPIQDMADSDAESENGVISDISDSDDQWLPPKNRNKKRLKLHAGVPVHVLNTLFLLLSSKLMSSFFFYLHFFKQCLGAKKPHFEFRYKFEKQTSFLFYFLIPCHY